MSCETPIPVAVIGHCCGGCDTSHFIEDPVEFSLTWNRSDIFRFDCEDGTLWDTPAAAEGCIFPPLSTVEVIGVDLAGTPGFSFCGIDGRLKGCTPGIVKNVTLVRVEGTGSPGPPTFFTNDGPNDPCGFTVCLHIGNPVSGCLSRSSLISWTVHFRVTPPPP